MTDARESRSRSRSPRGDVGPTGSNPNPSLEDVTGVVKGYVCTNTNQFARSVFLAFGLFMAYEIKVFMQSGDFVLLIIVIPVTYGIGGLVLYKDQGWQFFQPGVGGARFMALQAAGWIIYALSILLIIANISLGDSMLSAVGFVAGLGSFTLIVTSLFTYSNLEPKFLGVDAPEQKAKLTKVFNEEIQLKLMQSGENPSDLWYLFIGMQVLLSMGAFWLNTGFLHHDNGRVKILANLFSASMFAVAVPITHAVGGKWKHINTNYSGFQPGKGGICYILLQFLGWFAFSIAILCSLLLLYVQIQVILLPAYWPFLPADQMPAIIGALGLTSEAIITASLFAYTDKDSAAEISTNYKRRGMVTTIVFGCLNALYKNRHLEDRDVLSTWESPADWEKGEKKFQELVRGIKTTGDQYLIIGCGFLGKRLIKRLLERGETRIRVFDIVPHNPFEGDDRVEYIRGDVTKAESIGPACRGVNTVYATFAIIRFMDRLEHQAALSYTINVGGTERVIDACKKHNVSRMVVTSSSHSTTDEHSQPRMGRDENAAYVVRETAHNHYGWTKAIADKKALEANGAKTANGGTLQVAIVRPCSAIFGGDDRLIIEKMLSMGVVVSLGFNYVLDCIYVENVVLGHLLLEDALQKGKRAGGEAYCVSNEDPMAMYQFWNAVDQHIQMLRVRVPVELVWIPTWPFWVLAYISEWNQRIFKGKVSLGSDMNMLSPGLLATVNMSYAYKSDKARRQLGYQPAYTVDQGIQKSIIDYVKNYRIGEGHDKTK